MGIEVKYHEDLRGAAAEHRERFDQIARDTGWFRETARADLLRPPLQQVWREHLLAGSILGRRGFADGLFVFLHPAGNRHCVEAAARYAECLTSGMTFVAGTLEDLVAAVKRHTTGRWVDLVADRYLALDKVDAALATG